MLGDRFIPGFRRVQDARKAAESLTAWRIDGTLREFPKFPPVDLWFDYPVHRMDDSGMLADVDPEAEGPTWPKNFKKKRTAKERRDDRKESIETAFEACGMDGEVTLKSLTEYLGVTEKTVRARLKEHGRFWIDEGKVGRK